MYDMQAELTQSIKVRNHTVPFSKHVNDPLLCNKLTKADAQMSFSDYFLSRVRLSIRSSPRPPVCTFLTFPPEQLGQFHPNLVKGIRVN